MRTVYFFNNQIFLFSLLTGLGGCSAQIIMPEGGSSVDFSPTSVVISSDMALTASTLSATAGDVTPLGGTSPALGGITLSGSGSVPAAGGATPALGGTTPALGGSGSGGTGATSNNATSAFTATVTATVTLPYSGTAGCSANSPFASVICGLSSFTVDSTSIGTTGSFTIKGYPASIPAASRKWWKFSGENPG